MTISVDCNSENVTLRCDIPRIRPAPSRMYWLLNTERIGGLPDGMTLNAAYDVRSVSNTITYDFNKGPLHDAACVVKWFEAPRKEWVVHEGQCCAWWSYCMVTFSALLALCDGEIRVVSLNKLFNKQSNYLLVYDPGVKCDIYACIVNMGLKWLLKSKPCMLVALYRQSNPTPSGLF